MAAIGFDFFLVLLFGNITFEDFAFTTFFFGIFLTLWTFPPTRAGDFTDFRLGFIFLFFFIFLFDFIDSI